MQAFWLFLVAQFIIGSGLTLLQTAANHYVVKVGPIESAAVRSMFMGLMNKGAGVIVPLVFTAVVLGDLTNVNATSLAAMNEVDRSQMIDTLASGLVNPYLIMAGIFILLAALMKKIPLPELDLSSDDKDGETIYDKKGEMKTSITQFPSLILGALTIFFYVGAEVIAGDTIGLFASNLGVANATSLTSYTMAFMLIGYALGIVLIPRVMSQEFALAASAITGVIFSFSRLW
jgi:fucose permease